jgi:hypothetical protein
MTQNPRVRLRSLPRLGPRVPGWMLRVAIGIVGAGLCVTQLPLGFWFGLGLVLAVLAAIAPRLSTAWALILLLGSSLLWREPSPLNVTFYALLAGVHLLHLLASYALVVPIGGWLQLRAFTASLKRYLIVQVPLQLLTALALFAFSPRAGHTLAAVPVVGIAAGVALVALTVVLVLPFLRERPRD